MRGSFVAVALAGLVLAGCAAMPSMPSMPWSRSHGMPTRASCPAMTNEQWSPLVDAAVHKTFDRELQKRFGDTAFQMRIAWGKTDNGDTLIAAQRIGPAQYALPAPGEGGEVELVFKACKGKLLKTRKRAGLEKKPRPLAAEPAN